MKQSLSLLFLTLLSLSPGAAGDLTLWYRQPARVPMNDALPIGNWRLGGLVLGVPERERLIVNEAQTERKKSLLRYGTRSSYYVLI